MNEKLMRILGAIIAVFVLILLIIFIMASCTKRTITYEKLEDKMLQVAKEYYRTHKDELPKENKETTSLSLAEMIEAGKIETLDKLLKNKEADCSGYVIVTKNNDSYAFTPYLNCGKEYNAVSLKDKLIEGVVAEGVGLYQVGERYIFKGEVTNNYVKMSNSEKLYRIIRINSDGSIRLLALDESQQVTWDNRYNPDRQFNSGINDFLVNGLSSRLKETIDKMASDTTIWNENIMGYIQPQDLCVGKRKQKDTTKDDSIECKTKIEDQNFGVLIASEFLDATLDPNCKYVIDSTCRNYNWLAALQYRQWLMTADAETTDQVYVLNGGISLISASSYATVHLVFDLNPNIRYVSGNGTETDPYIFK